MWRHVDVMWTEVSEQCIVSTFRVEKMYKRGTRFSLQPSAHVGSSLANFFYPDDGDDTFRGFGFLVWIQEVNFESENLRRNIWKTDKIIKLP
jgi:hypothetical protein